MSLSYSFIFGIYMIIMIIESLSWIGWSYIGDNDYIIVNKYK
jgi:hypothetical protein